MKRRLLFSLALLLLCVSSNSASAESEKLKTIKSEIKTYKSLEAKIRRHGLKLSESEKSKLKSSLPTGLRDSDHDGVPDIIEHGVDDSDECSSSDHQGGTEVEAKGLVSSLSGSTFVVGGKSFVVSSSTVYRNGDVSNLINGACVEVKGRTATGSSDNDALRVSFKDSGDCS